MPERIWESQDNDRLNLYPQANFKVNKNALKNLGMSTKFVNLIGMTLEKATCSVLVEGDERF